MALRHIIGFVGIELDVEEPRALLGPDAKGEVGRVTERQAVAVVVLEAAEADCAQVAHLVEPDRPPRFGLPSPESLDQAFAVDHPIGRRWNAQQVEHGGEDVDPVDEVLVHPSSPDPRRPADHERHPHAALEDAELAASQATRAALKPWAIIRADNDQGIPGDAGPLESVEDLARAPVELLDHVSVAPGRRGPESILADVQGDVGKGVRQVEEEGAVLVLLDEGHRLFGVATGQRRLIDRMALDDLLVLPHLRLALIV